MSRIKSKFIKWGTAAEDVNSRVIPANFTPSNYSPVQIGTEGIDKVSSHLKGLDNAIGNIPQSSPGDILESAFIMANNVSTPTNVTGFLFANAVVRSFETLVSIEIDASDDLFEVFTLRGIQKSSSWVMSSTATGDSSGVTLSITSTGQIQYVSDNYVGYVSGKIKFRAITTSIA